MMADVEQLVVRFQTQLSDVMETVVKTAMYEVTRLVEDGLVEQLKARSLEVEELRVRLQWTEKHLSDLETRGDTERTGRKSTSVSPSAVTAVEPRGTEVESPVEQDVVRRGHVVEDSDKLEIKSEEGHEEDKSADPVHPVWTPHVGHSAKAEEGAKSFEEIKKEAVLPISCSSLNLKEWEVDLGGVHPEPQIRNEMNDEFLRHIVQRDLDPIISAKYVVSHDQQETNIVASTTHIKAFENNTKWLQVATAEKDSENMSSQKATKELESVAAKSQCSPTSPRPRCDVFGISVKQEVIADPEPVETHTPNKAVPNSVRPAYLKQHRTGTPKQNRISHKAFLQAIKSKAGPSFRPVSLHHLQRPLKRQLALQTNSSSELVSAHSQFTNSNHRTPSTSKACSPVSLSVQRARLGDKPVFSRSGAPWISTKSQPSSTSPHTNSSLLVDLPFDGPRQIFRCGQCGKCFPHPSNLKSHLLTHSGERPFCCSLCGRTFTKLSNLKAHRRVHTGERPYSCVSCGKRFTQNCNLKRHQRIHLDG